MFSSTSHDYPQRYPKLWLTCQQTLSVPIEKFTHRSKYITTHQAQTLKKYVERESNTAGEKDASIITFIYHEDSFPSKD